MVVPCVMVASSELGEAMAFPKRMQGVPPGGGGGGTGGGSGGGCGFGGFVQFGQPTPGLNELL